MDEKKLMEFMGKLVTDMGGAAMMASVLVGEELGLYRAMANSEPVSADELAQVPQIGKALAKDILAQALSPGRKKHLPV